MPPSHPGRGRLGILHRFGEAHQKRNSLPTEFPIRTHNDYGGRLPLSQYQSAALGETGLFPEIAGVPRISACRRSSFLQPVDDHD